MKMKNHSSPSDSRRGRRWLLALLGISFVGAAFIVFFPAGNPNAIAISATPVGEIRTNGEHWVIFKFDAPKSRAVIIQQVLAVGGDRMLSPAWTRADSFPDPDRPVHERIQAGVSKLVKVRRVGGGDWQARFDLMVPLKFGGQWHARIKACWRQNSFKPWSRNYLERGRRFVESEFVKTTETVLPTASPRPAAVPPSAFLPFPFAMSESETAEGSHPGALIRLTPKEQSRSDIVNSDLLRN